MFDETRSHRPDKRAKASLSKIKQKRFRSLQSSCFMTALEQLKKHHIYTKVIDLVSRRGETIINIEQRKKKYSITLSGEVFCTCTTSQKADRKTCSHVIWEYTNVLGLNETDVTVAQVSFQSKSLAKLMSLCPSPIPVHLTKCKERNNDRMIHRKVQEHPKFNNYQEWVIDRKGNTVPCRCSGCLKKGVINTGDLHFYVLAYYMFQLKMLLWKRNLDFALACVVTNQNGTFHNITDLKGDMKIICPKKIRLTDEEQKSILSEGFTVSFKEIKGILLYLVTLSYCRNIV